MLRFYLPKDRFSVVIIPLPLLGVAQHSVGRCDFFEAPGGLFFVADILIGMKFKREPAIALLYLRRANCKS